MTDRAPETTHEGLVSTREFVGRRVARIQAGYTRRPQEPGARAALAQLRRGVGQEVGAVLEILELTVNPDSPRPRTEAPTSDEIAIHLAMTLYAIHQQSQTAPMHVPSISFGKALGAIRYADGQENPGVVRRFQAMGTAVGLAELTHHARTLITLLRGAGRGFDYASFADDLVAFQMPGRADGVRLRWGRDFFRVSPPTPPTSAATATEEQS